jgi:hypothetical protein
LKLKKEVEVEQCARLARERDVSILQKELDDLVNTDIHYRNERERLLAEVSHLRARLREYDYTVGNNNSISRVGMHGMSRASVDLKMENIPTVAGAHSLTHSLIHSLTHSLTHLLTYLLTHL